MGTSTDAMLFYGYIWDEPWDEEDGGIPYEWSQIVAKKRGIENPWDEIDPLYELGLPYQERENKVKEWIETHDAELDAWHAARKVIEKEFGIEVGYHCSDGYACPYLYIAGSEVTAYRGSPKNVTGLVLRAFAWDNMLDRFLKEFDVECPKDRDGEADKPGWHLASWWG